MVEVMFLIPTPSQTLGMEGSLVLYCPKLDHLEVILIHNYIEIYQHIEKVIDITWNRRPA